MSPALPRLPATRQVLAALVLSLGVPPLAAAVQDPAAPPEVPLEAREEPARPCVHRYKELGGAEVRDGTGRALARVADIVFEPASGELTFVVLAFGGTVGIGEERVAVPWQALRGARVVGEQENALAVRHLELDWPVERLEGAPRFDAAARRDLDAADWQARVRAHFDAPSRPQGDPAPLASVGELLGKPVVDAAGVPFGSLVELLVDWHRGRIAALVLGNGGVAGVGERQRLGAWAGLELRRGEGGAVRLRWGIPRERFEGAPEYRDDDWAEVCAPEFVSALFRSCGYAHPSGEPLDPE